MPIINISVRNKRATAECGSVIVCKNGDYKAVFDFDEEWLSNGAKTARFAYGESFIPVVFVGNECDIPKLPNTFICGIEVEADGIRTTVPAWVDCEPVLDDSYGEIEPPSEDVYQQIMRLLSEGALNGDIDLDNYYTKEETEEAIESAKEEMLSYADDAIAVVDTSITELREAYDAVNDNIGDISAALDELHNYAQNIVLGVID